MEPALRLFVFLSVLAMMLAWEKIHRFRPLHQAPAKRLSINMGLMALNFVVLRLCSSGGAFFVAVQAAEKRWGLFTNMDWPALVEVLLGLILMDVAIYFQHRVFHNVPLLWRLHRVHHTDQDIDVTTAVRFHALEILLSMYFKVLLVVIFGIAPFAVVAFEIILNACALFNHGNVRLPDRLEPGVRQFVITPDMHRIHHSVDPQELNSNFGFSVSWWDRIFGTYREAPRLGQESMKIGLIDEPDPGRLGFLRLIWLPFEKRR